VNYPKFIIQVSKGLIRSHQTRRHLMFYSVLLALVMVFAGSTFLGPDRHEHPLIFLGYWGVCSWITLLTVLLALYDMVKVRAEAQRAQRLLQQEYRKKGSSDENPG
jgi:hypothetical protein